jgi:transcriptional regulator with XRE-family HTH domain
MVVKTTKPIAGRPYADTALAQHVSKQIDIAASAGKNQRQIAKEIGYDSPNMISQIKRGELKLPLEKVALLAKALNVDPAHLFRLAMQQQWPGEEKVIAEVFGKVLTKNETEIIDFIREIRKGSDQELTPEQVRRLKSAFGD